MPIYEYACLDCGREFEELVRGDARPLCPACGKDRLERRMSVSAAHNAAPDASGQNRCCGPNCNLEH